MASNINPNNIDTTYPIAGQDNDSQGFRDNFTNIKTNFEYAETEIDDLQAKGIFKSALTGTTLDNDMAGGLVENMKTQGFRATRIALGALTGTATIDYTAGQWYTVTTSGSITLAFDNIPASGNASWFNVRINVTNVAYTVTLPATVVGTAGIQGYNSNIITFAEAGTYEFEFHTDDGGTSIYLSELTRPRANFMNPINLASADSVAAGAACSLATTTSYFTTSGTETGTTLAAGVEGQIKILIMLGSAGNSRAVTVTDAGWKSTGSGTGVATFNAIGEACTLQYINNKWYAIGNNGVVFSDS